MTITTAIDYLSFKKKPWRDLSLVDKKAFNPFMTHRLLSTDPELIEIVNYIQRRHNLPVQQVYTLYFELLPEARLKTFFLNKKKQPGNKELLQVLAKYYEISQREVREYLNILKTENIKIILTGLGYQKDEIKKLLKP